MLSAMDSLSLVSSPSCSFPAKDSHPKKVVTYSFRNFRHHSGSEFNSNSRRNSPKCKISRRQFPFSPSVHFNKSDLSEKDSSRRQKIIITVRPTVSFDKKHSSNKKSSQVSNISFSEQRTAVGEDIATSSNSDLDSRNGTGTAFPEEEGVSFRDSRRSTSEPSVPGDRESSLEVLSHDPEIFSRKLYFEDNSSSLEKSKRQIEHAFRTKLGGIALNVVALGYAGTAVIVKAMEDPSIPTGASVPTSVEFFLRFGMATVAVAIPYFLREQWRESKQVVQHVSRETRDYQPPIEKKREESWSLIGQGMELGFWMFLTYGGQSMGLETSSADHAALLLTLSVVLVPFLEASGGRVISRNVWFATLLATMGMMLLEGGSVLGSDPSMGFDLFQMPVGHLWCLAGAVGSAIHVVRAEILCSKSDPLGLLAVQLATVTALSLPWLTWDILHSWENLRSLVFGLDNIPWFLIFLAGPIGTGLCEWFELEALRYVKASTATLVLTASPLWGSLLAFIFLGETLDKSSAAGALLILSGSLQVQLFAPKEETEKDDKDGIEETNLQIVTQEKSEREKERASFFQQQLEYVRRTKAWSWVRTAVWLSAGKVVGVVNVLDNSGSLNRTTRHNKLSERIRKRQ